MIKQMKDYYTVPEIAKLVNIEYHAVYYHINRNRVPVKRSGIPPNELIYIAHDDLARFLLTVDWLAGVTLQRDHPFERERVTFLARYIQRSDLAKQLGHAEYSLVNWSCLHGFPTPAVRNGWYNRKAVLDWLRVHRPKDFARINGRLS